MSWFCSVVVLMVLAVSSHTHTHIASDELHEAAEAAFQLLRTDTAAAARAARQVRDDYPDLPDAIRVRMLWIEGAGLSHSGQHRQAIPVLEEACALARASGDAGHLRRSLRFLAVSRYETAQFERGRDAAAEAIEITEQMEDDSTYIVRLLNELAANETALGNHAAAVRCYERGLPIVQEFGDVRTEMLIRNNLAAVMAEIGFLDDAIQQYEVVLGHAVLDGNQFITAQVSTELGALLVNQGFPDRGRTLLEQGLSLAEQGQLRDTLAIAHANLGDFFVAENEPQEARRHYEAAARIWEELDRPARLADATIRLAALQSPATDEQDDANGLLARAKQLDQAGDFMNAFNHYVTAAEAYRREEQWQEVVRIQERMLELARIQWEQENLRTLAELNASLDAVIDDRRIVDLRSDAVLTEFQAQMTDRENRRLLGGLIVLLVMLLIVGVALRGRGAALAAARRANAELEIQRKLQRDADRIAAHQQRSECLELLAAGIAHDFNNSLTAIAAMAELGVMTDDKVGKDDLLSQITSSTRHAAALTSQLVQFLGESTADEQKCELVSVIGAIRELLGTIVRGRAELQIQLPSEEMHALISSAHVQQIVVNLITNAAEAAAPAGRIQLVVESQRLGTSELRHLTEPGSAQVGSFRLIRVTDNGPGIPEEIRSRILDPYFSTKRAGRGMGLASVQGIVKAAGGAIDVSPSAEGGACVLVVIPAAQSSKGATESSGQQEFPAERQPDESNGGVASILLVDDETRVVNLMQQILHRAGFRVLTASNAAEALEIVRLRKEDLQCVVTDFAMPGEDGVWLAEHAREISPGLPVILCSGFAEQGRASHPDIALFLQKPYTGRELVQSVRCMMPA